MTLSPQTGTTPTRLARAAGLLVVAALAVSTAGCSSTKPAPAPSDSPASTAPSSPAGSSAAATPAPSGPPTATAGPGSTGSQPAATVPDSGLNPPQPGDTPVQTTDQMPTGAGASTPQPQSTDPGMFQIAP